MALYQTHYKGSLSQIIVLVYILLFRKYCFENTQKVTHFFYINKN